MRGGIAALKDISLTIFPSEHVAILGPNGCGKSTLIKTITRECYPLHQPGSALAILGRTAWDVTELRSLLGIISNDLQTQCTREITGSEIVLSGFFSSIGIWPNHQVEEHMRVKAAEVLAFLDASHLAEKPVEEMSSGEARRVLIGRALVHGPQALLLDEPSTSLDIPAQHELRSTMSRLAASGLGIVLVTHHLSDIIPEIERVVFMKQGRIVEDGSKKQLITAAKLEKLFGVKVELTKREGCFHCW